MENDRLQDALMEVDYEAIVDQQDDESDLTGSPDKSKERIQEMQDFFAIIQEINDKVREMENNITALKRLIKSTKTDDSPEIKNQIESLNDVIRGSSKSISELLKDINKQIEEIGAVEDCPDVRMRRTKHAQLSEKFMKCLRKFNQTQQKAKKAIEKKMKRMIRIANPDIQKKDIDEIMSKGGDEAIQTMFGDKNGAKQSLKEMEQRNAELMKLEQSILDLNTLFEDMAILIDNQGDMIDHIESNVTKAKEYTGMAASDLKKAVKSQKSLQKKRIYLIVAAVIVLSVVALFFYRSR